MLKPAPKSNPAAPRAANIAKDPFKGSISQLKFSTL
jgi:hypothetical protein